MPRSLVQAAILAAALAASPSAGLARQERADPQSMEVRIAAALAAGPREAIGDATIWDWPAGWPASFGAPRVLRQGTSGWICVADDPAWPGTDAMCFDQEWEGWYRAYMTNTSPPRPRRIGIGYGLTIDTQSSNVDPYAEKATSTNQWHHVKPHVMILFPDPGHLAGFATDPGGGGAYVMYPGTPFAHLMVPIR